MIMQARHHLWGTGCVPHPLSMTRRWGPVGLLRVGGMGLGALGQPSPVGFANFADYQAAVIASFPACPPPYDPTCENPRDASISAALAAWTTNPQSCANVVCNASGSPQITPAPSGTGSGYNTTSGFVPVSVTTTYTPPASTPTPQPVATPVAAAAATPTVAATPKPPAPAQPAVVNPSPVTQLTTTGSTTTSPTSVVSQANGTVAIPGTVASTVGGVVSTTTDTSGDIVSGVPNWVLFVAGGVALVLLTRK